MHRQTALPVSALAMGGRTLSGGCAGVCYRARGLPGSDNPLAAALAPASRDRRDGEPRAGEQR